MGTAGPRRTPFGPAQRARAHHPPPGLNKPIITGLFSVAALIRAGLNLTRIDPNPDPQDFALLGQALDSGTYFEQSILTSSHVNA